MGFDFLCQAEVHDLDHPLAGDHDVGGLDVAVYDILCVSRGEGSCHIADDLRGLVHLEPRLPHHPAQQGLALHILHLDILPAFPLADAVDCDYVRMAERCGCPRFAGEALDRVGQLLDHVERQDLQDAVPLERQMLRLVHRAHAALSELLDNSVLPNGLAHQGVIVDLLDVPLWV